VHVEPQTLGQQLLRDEDAVAGHDDHARLARERGQLLRLLHGDLQPLGDLLGRRGRLLAPAAPRPVRAREQELDVVAPVGNPFEHGRSERRRGRNRDLHG
jgi:hypothetical protein